MELKEELKIDVDASTSKENGTQPREILEKSMHCTSNFEDHSFDVEDSTDDRCGGYASGRKEEMEVDIVECTDVSDCEVELSECNDGTDGYSSSFSGMVSETENEAALNDQEVDSPMYTDTPLVFRMRKKRLTDHWRRFIRPIMWRCKWLELRIKEFQSQAQTYDKELKEYYQAKQFELENLKSEGLGTKSLPLLCQTQKNRVMKRKKRKRVEQTTDLPSYLSNHNLFSYYEHRKAFADGALLNDNSLNLDNRTKNAKDESVFNEEQPSLVFREGDEHLEQILLKIEAAKSEACNLKNRVDKVLGEFPWRFSSVNTLSLPGPTDAFTGTNQKPPLLLENEDEKPVKSLSVSFQHNIPEDNTRDILMSENAVSSQGEGKPVPDKRTQNAEQTSIEGSSGNAKKRASRNRETKEEIIQRPRVLKEKPRTSAPASKFKLPKRKRKRGKRRSGSAGIRRRS